MTQDGTEEATQTDDSREEIDHVEFAKEWRVGPGAVGQSQRISGPRRAVREIMDSDNKDILRWGVFVLTFVPITTTLIAKLPEIITAVANALD